MIESDANAPQALVLAGADRALFASDVHLDDRDPATADAFFGALAREASAATHVFLLGDLFEAWVGDDDTSAVGRRAAQALASLAARGCRVFLMRGNRDFLLDVPLPAAPAGDRCFSAQAGATMLADPCAVSLFGTPALLSHGDALCTDDADYQAFRALSRGERWQREFLARTLPGRIAAARSLRARSEAAKGAKADYLMDVNAAAVERAMRDAGVSLLIHGHTHRPAHHRLSVDGRDAQRWVLPDWDARIGRGGMLAASAQAMQPLGRWQ